MRTSAPIGELKATLFAAVRAGFLTGILFGTLDAGIALFAGTAALGPFSAVACVSAALSEYVAVAITLLVATALVMHPAIGRWAPAARFQGLTALGLTVGCFAELYWWSRPYVFYGRPAFSAERIGAAVVMLLAALVAARFLARPLCTRAARHGWKLAAPLAVLSAAGAAYALSQRNVLDDHGRPHAGTRELPNVLLVVVDALRQDTLGCYGSPVIHSPYIDRLAAEGVLFENAFVQAPFTWTSFGSFLTGKYPRRHGLVKMAPGTRMVPNVTLASHLEYARRRDGGELRDTDYLSVTFHTGTLSTGSGLLQGFDLYYEQLAGHGLVVAKSAWSVYRSDLLLHILRAKFAQKVGGDVAGTSRAWLEENGSRRFLAMVHLYSTHTPYDPPQEFRQRYVDPAYQGPVRAFYAQHREAIERGEAQPTAADVAQIRALYAAGVTQADAAIGALMQELERQGKLDETLVIVTSDHGESLGEGGLWEHNHMVQTNLRIPLVMRWPAGLPAGRRVDALVDSIDLFPTVCDLLGLELPEQQDRYAVIDGASLLPLVRGEVDRVRDFSFAENGLFLSVQDRRWKLILPTDLVDEEAWAKGVNARGVRPVLFDLENDPGEERDALPEHRAEADRLAGVLRAWNATMPIPRMELSHRDLEAMERFSQLGYTGGVGAGTQPPAGGQ